MAKKTIKLNYLSAERFSKDYAQIKKGKIFLRSQNPLPAGYRLVLEFNLSGIDRTFRADGRVALSIDSQAAEKFKKPQGMLVVMPGGVDDLLQNLEASLREHEAYRNVLSLPRKIAVSRDTPGKSIDKHRSPPARETPQTKPLTPIKLEAKALYKNGTAADPAGTPDDKRIQVQIIGAKGTGGVRNKGPGKAAQKTKSSEDKEKVAAESSPDASAAILSLDWIKAALAQEKAGSTKQVADAPETTAPPITEKKNLSVKEREKVKPAGDFLMDLTKAMLRSGYYASDHPGSKNAKRGLYDALQESLIDSDEIMITLQEAGGKTDILITGILEDPVNVRILVGAGMSELFVPKLREYFKRQSLVSFAIKKTIPLEKFEKFVDIMSDPKSEQRENVKVGELLSHALAEKGISEISTVFMDDMIAIEQNIPWRVEMAIQRLAKDLKLLPIFQGKSDAAIADLKLQITKDIIRPLRHPEFLKDLVINCYIVAAHVENMQTREIEQAIIDAFPDQALLPTSKCILGELDHLKDAWKEHPMNEVLKRRIASVKRILNLVARRLVVAEIPGTRTFFEQLYRNEILTFDELPPDVQYLMNTMKMTDDVRAHVEQYTGRILKVESVADAVLMLQLFKRVAPLLIENQDWPVLLAIIKAAANAAEAAPATFKKTGLAEVPQDFIIDDITDGLVTAYLGGDESQRLIIDEITGRTGPLGVEILSRVLSAGDDRGAHKAATDAMIKKGDLARHWIRQVLDDDEQVWHLQANALRVLRYTGQGNDDIDRARKRLGHAHPSVRDEALNTAISLKADDAEQLIIAALGDEDDKVRWRATTFFSELPLLSEASISLLLDLIKAEPPEEKEAAAKHALKLGQLIRAMGARTDLPQPDLVEVAILELARKTTRPEKGLLKRLKKSGDPEQAGILAAAIVALGNIGDAAAEAFLQDLVDNKSPLTDTAQEAIDSIRARRGGNRSSARTENPGSDSP